MSVLLETLTGGYRHCLRNARLVQVVVLTLCALALVGAQRFTFDASSDTLVAEDDPALAYHEGVADRFGDAPFVVFTFSPESGDLFSDASLDALAALHADLAAAPGVVRVTSILDAPLLRSPPVPLAELADGHRTLRDADVDRRLAREELTHSPLFRELLVSADGASTALRVDLAADTALARARAALDDARAARARGEVPAQRVDELTAAHRTLRERAKTDNAERIARLRAIRDAHEAGARIFIGGVPMIAADIIDYVRRDMVAFGAGTALLMGIALYAFFGRLRWVLIPLGTVSVTTLLVIGLLGWLDRPATAISSNFVALIAIVTLSFTIHLIARYRELCISGFSDDHVALVYEAMRSKLAPCLYTAATTAVAFASLLTSDIVPVVEFGWIMCAGIAIAFAVTYGFFAGVLVLLPYPKAPTPRESAPAATRLFGELSVRRPGIVLIAAVLLALLAADGVARLSLENRFVDYFHGDSEIHRGLTFIDRRLGGTLPLDVVLEFEPWRDPGADADALDDFGDFGDFDAFDDFGTAAPDPFPERFWFTPERLATLERFHDWLDDRRELGKTVSVSTLEQVARSFTDGAPLTYLQLTAVLARIPQAVREELIAPYASPATGELRIAARIHETGPGFSKSELIADIERFAVETLGFAPDAVHVTGAAVLFDDLLAKLFASQTSTLGFVVVATLAMFAVLLRSPGLALIGLVPNLLAPLAVLGFMGHAGIPLDLMTITLAAIVVGIGVDDAIHYLHRFRQERAAGLDVPAAVRAAHRSIGKALYFTTATVVLGFSVLSFSHFVPTVQFGWLTATGMVLALLANLTVLPALLVTVHHWRSR